MTAGFEKEMRAELGKAEKEVDTAFVRPRSPTAQPDASLC
jgi:hypothetical protein